MTRSTHDEINLELSRRPTTTSALEHIVISNDAANTNTHNTRGVPITTYNGNQYGAFYNSSFQVVLWKRPLTGKSSQASFQTLTGKTITDFSDNHETISLAVDKNGVIMVAYGHHDDPIQFFTLADPEDITSTPSADTDIDSSNPALDRITYPIFVKDSRSDMHLVFRGNETGGLDDDMYMYTWNASSKTFSQTTGTASNGKLTEGTDEGFGNYFSYPFVDWIRHRIHFQYMWRQESGADGNTVQYFYYDITTGTFHKSSGDQLTLPIGKADGETVDPVLNAQGLEILIQRPSIVVDTRGSIYCCYAKDDSGGNLQTYVAKKAASSSTWDINQVTDGKNSPFSGSVITLPSLFISSDGTLYLFTKSTSRRGSLEVYESTDNAATWSLPYALFPFDVGLIRMTNADYVRWYEEDEMYFYLEHKIGNDGDTLTVSSKTLSLIRWIPSQGMKSAPFGTSGIISPDDVYLVSDGGDVVLSGTNIRLDSTVSNQVVFSNSTFPVAQFVKETTNVSSVSSGVAVKATSSGDMVDGLGTGIVFQIEDDVGTQNNIGRVSFLRDASDDSKGRFVVECNTAFDNVLEIDTDGRMTISVFTDANRGTASNYAAGTMIWNSDDAAPNWSDGTNWKDASGVNT